MNKKKILTCCFSGHRDIPEEKIPQIQKQLWTEVQKQAEQGTKIFYTGGARGFDTLATLAVLECKKQYPQIQLVLCLPCHEQTKGWNMEDVARYHQIKEQASSFVYVSEQYYSGCMHKRNRYMADRSDVCICYLTGASGGTKYTVDYCIRKGIPVINLAEG